MTKKVIKFKKLIPEATIPTYAHDGDIGMDVFATSVEYDKDNDVYIYHTGLACETDGHMGVLGMMKSSIYKHGESQLTNGVGLIDSDQYRGEILFIYRNRTSMYQRANNCAWHSWWKRGLWYRTRHSFEDEVEWWLNRQNPWHFAPYSAGEAIGQLVPLTFDSVDIQEVKELTNTERGVGGFGSSETSKKKLKKKAKKKTSNIKFPDNI